MTGKPAARIDDNVAYGKIVTGSLTVLIGSQGGVACSVCPGGMAQRGGLKGKGANSINTGNKTG